MKKKIWVNGYFTIEAALLMPMVLFCIFFVLYVGFLQYDRCIAEQDAKIMLLRASNMKEKSESEIEAELSACPELATKKKVLFSSSLEKRIKVQKTKTQIGIQGGVRTVLQQMNFFTYAAEYETDRYNPVEFIRNCRKAEQYFGNTIHE